MPKFGSTSKRRLNTCHPDIQRVMFEVVYTVDCAILDGHRGAARQNRLYAIGQSKLQFPESRHNRVPSEAVDAAPYWPDSPHIRWPYNAESLAERLKIIGQWYFFGGYVLRTAQQMGIQLRWGGDWNRNWYVNDNRFDDLVHFEMVKGG